MDYYIVFCGFGNPYNILRQISNLTRQHATGTSVATDFKSDATTRNWNIRRNGIQFISKLYD
ncbi:MAG: hypothetical protein II453_08050 [Alphaproteobacteria bacterium]|nr:hypothetical protein [Alphaproteobacteria bacterium]MBQ3944326.1 hypothetical protein [Alphaproteobacteria bacterium]